MIAVSANMLIDENINAEKEFCCLFKDEEVLLTGFLLVGNTDDCRVGVLHLDPPSLQNGHNSGISVLTVFNSGYLILPN
jgi:hypothetical protein